MATAAIIAGGAVLGSVVGAVGQNKAANTQADAMDQASRISAAAAAQAREDVLEQIGPGLDGFRKGIAEAQGTLEGGANNVMKMLLSSTVAADQRLTQAGADAQRTLMGSEMASQGIPYSQIGPQLDQQLGPSPTAPAYQPTPDGGVAPVDPAAPGMQPATQPDQVDPATGQPTTLGAAAQQTVMQPATQPGTAGIGFGASTGHIEGGRQAALGELATGEQRGQQFLAEGRAGALGALQPYSAAGQQALNKEAALSGALGPEAQQAAIAGFMESPGQKYLREQQEKSLLRNQAAIGGLGGGNVRTALQEQAMGIASTRMQDDLENMRSLAGRGQQVAGQEANIYGTTGTQQAGLATQLGQQASGVQQMSSQQQAQLAQQMGITVAELQRQIGEQGANLATGLGGQLAQTQAGLAGDISGLQQQRGTTELEVARGLGTQLANIGTRSGTQLAQLAGQKGSALAAGQYGVAQTIGQGISGLGQIAGYGMMGGFDGAPAQYNPFGTTK